MRKIVEIADYGGSVLLGITAFLIAIVFLPLIVAIDVYRMSKNK